MGKETVQNFIDSLAGGTVPAELNVYGQSLWWAGKGNWNLAHELIRDLGDQKAARIHAYLHRVEGDLSNAQYWYSRAGEKMPAQSLEKEWEELAVRFT